MNIDLNSILPIAGAIVTLGGAYLTVRKVTKDIAQSKQEQKEEILKEAMEEFTIREQALDNKIKAAELKIESLSDSIDKDLSHLKDTYNSEFKFLNSKIDALRDQLSDQHGSILALLTKLIDND